MYSPSLKQKFINSYLEQKGNLIEELSIGSLIDTYLFTDLCPYLTVIDSQNYGSAQLILDKVRNPNIKRLELQGNFKAEALQQFFSVKFSKLKQISIENSEGFSDENLMVMLQNGNSIQSLKLKGLAQVTNSSLQQIGNYGYNYESICLIDLNQIQQSALSFIFQQCQRVKKIKLALLGQIDSEVFQVIKQNSLYLQSLKLSRLVIQGNWIDEIVSIRQLNFLQLKDLNLNDQDIVKILKKETRLQTLDLCGNQITSNTFPLNDENDQPYPI